MKYLILKLRTIKKQAIGFIKWFIIAVIVGLIVGGVGTAFHYAVGFANEYQRKFWWLILLLPLGGIIIVFLYRLCHSTYDKGTNTIIMAARSEDKPSPFTAPLIFVSTFITHLLGGSAGREGAALQIGGGISSTIGSIIKMNKDDMKIITMCGMSAGFSAVFGTPMAACIFSMEVTNIGIIYYGALVPCIISAFVAKEVALVFGITVSQYETVIFPKIDLISFGKVVVLAVLCAILSIIFCSSLKACAKCYTKLFKNAYIKIIVGGFIVIGLTFLVNTRDYNSAGTFVIENALMGNARPEAFILKIIFTAVTLGAGYKGGEIIPTFFIGATFGCVMGGLLGLPPSFGASIGMMALFCGVTNCPITSIIISIELFGTNAMWLFAVAIAISYRLSGYYSLYEGQRFAYSKNRAEILNRKTH